MVELLNTIMKDNISNTSKGFTLAETLITLTIIGVVATLTIPSLFETHRDIQLNAQKKKVISMLENGYKYALQKDDLLAFDNLGVFACNNDCSCLSNVHKKAFIIAEEECYSGKNMPSSYTKSGATTSSNFSWDNVPYFFKVADGVTFGVLNNEDGTFGVVADLNGSSSPNKIAKDLVQFTIDKNGKITETSANLDNFETVLAGSNTSTNNSDTGASSSGGSGSTSDSSNTGNSGNASGYAGQQID